MHLQTIFAAVMIMGLTFFSLQGAAEQTREQKVLFSPQLSPKTRTFIETVLPPLSNLSPQDWARRLQQGQVLWAEADIDHNGIPEPFVMATGQQDCSQYGCQTYVARFSEGRWWLVTAQHMVQDDTVIQETKQGLYHVLRSGSFTTLMALESGKDVMFRPLGSTLERNFARDWLTQNANDQESPAFWSKAVAEGRIRIASADLNEDGIAERVLMINDSAWCGTAGCSAFILKHNSQKWDLLASTNMYETVRVLTEKQNGWHRLNTGTSLLTFNKLGHIQESTDLMTGEISQ